jgi:hypothetical protein
MQVMVDTMEPPIEEAIGGRTMENYKISNQNSVYHLPKNSKEVCILDLKTRAFVSEKLVWASDA